MRWPRLVPPSVCKTHIVIYLEGELQEDGGVEELPPIDTACNYSERSRQIVDAERRLIQLEATALLDGDIAPGKNIHGSCGRGRDGCPPAHLPRGEGQKPRRDGQLHKAGVDVDGKGKNRA